MLLSVAWWQFFGKAYRKFEKVPDTCWGEMVLKWRALYLHRWHSFLLCDPCFVQWREMCFVVEVCIIVFMYRVMDSVCSGWLGKIVGGLQWGWLLRELFVLRIVLRWFATYDYPDLAGNKLQKLGVFFPLSWIICWKQGNSKWPPSNSFLKYLQH